MLQFTSSALQFRQNVEIISDNFTEREEFFLLEATLTDPTLSGRVTVLPDSTEIRIRDDDCE